MRCADMIRRKTMGWKSSADRIEANVKLTFFYIILERLRSKDTQQCTMHLGAAKEMQSPVPQHDVQQHDTQQTCGHQVARMANIPSDSPTWKSK